MPRASTSGTNRSARGSSYALTSPSRPTAATANRNNSTTSSATSSAKSSGDGAKSLRFPGRSVKSLQPPCSARLNAEASGRAGTISGDPAEVGSRVDVERNPGIVALDQADRLAMPLEDRPRAAVAGQCEELAAERGREPDRMPTLAAIDRRRYRGAAQ